MQNGPGRVGLASVSAAVVLLTVAVATMASWYEDDWFLFIPIHMVVLGAYVMLVGLSDRSTAADRFKYANGSFLMFWGSLSALIGLVLLVNHYYPGNGIWLFVIVLVWLAISALLFAMRPKRG
jgi:cobalamin synthase